MYRTTCETIVDLILAISPPFSGVAGDAALACFAQLARQALDHALFHEWTLRSAQLAKRFSVIEVNATLPFKNKAKYIR